MWLIMLVLYCLLAIAIVVGLYYLVRWVLDFLGVAVPERIIRVIFVILGLLAAIWALSGHMATTFHLP